ncbi:hypothetical protein EVAR_41092_1 [Eumeta japonica]|uniref:Uncharacterized protein n=1 Tax=Eumeta variegata TaxID=151549 RepID=A0A4C1XC25_EUMVA|nr:hypothetical protein EVAR_41092_1 [Eumeta japonica]
MQIVPATDLPPTVDVYYYYSVHPIVVHALRQRQDEANERRYGGSRAVERGENDSSRIANLNHNSAYAIDIRTPRGETASTSRLGRMSQSVARAQPV